MIHVFLSASVPLPTRDQRFFATADVLLIREAIKALVEVVLPRGRITCGGHPAITPLLSLFVHEAGLSPEHITIFQSAFFANEFPPDLSRFVDVRVVPSSGADRAESLRMMRTVMIRSSSFTAAVAIGGMEGVLEEMSLFRQQHPSVPLLPVASTGAAAALLFDAGAYEPSLRNDLSYSSFFRRRLLHPPGR